MPWVQEAEVVDEQLLLLAHESRRNLLDDPEPDGLEHRQDSPRAGACPPCGQVEGEPREVHSSVPTSFWRPTTNASSLFASRSSMSTSPAARSASTGGRVVVGEPRSPSLCQQAPLLGYEPDRPELIKELVLERASELLVTSLFQIGERHVWDVASGVDMHVKKILAFSVSPSDKW